MLDGIDNQYAATAWARWAASDRHGTYRAWLLPGTEGDALAGCRFLSREHEPGPDDPS